MDRRLAVVVMEFVCADCADTFARPSRKGPLPKRCDECRRAEDSRRAMGWAKANPEKAKANGRAAHARNRERYNRRSADYHAAHRAEARVRATEWKAANRDRVRDSHYRRQFGISLADYDAMAAAQGGRCLICGTTEPDPRWNRFHVDHCHETGVVRGLLCVRCNIAIGLLGDNPELMLRAAEYVAPRKVVRSA